MSSHNSLPSPVIDEKVSYDVESMRAFGPETNTGFYNADLDKVQRKLEGRHMQMFAIGTVIGTGLFLGMGQLLAVAGPLGALLVFIHVGGVGYASLASITEMATFAPVSGSMSHFASRWVDPALGFAVGWNYFYTCAITLPAELTAAAVLIGYWDSNADHVAIYIAAFIVVAYAVNLIGARIFGNTEIVFSTLKLMLVAGLIIGGLAISLGGGPDHERHGFQYWKNPGPFVSSLEPGARGRWIGLLLAVVPAAFSMNGMEILTLAAAETRNPRKNLITSMRTVFFRIFVCYILTTLVVGMLIPSSDPALLRKTGTAAQSPFVLVFGRAGVKVLPHIVNAVVMTSALSSGNGMLYCASRMLFSLGVQGHAPKIVTRVTRDGLPYVAILIAGLFSFLAFLNVNNNGGKVFTWFSSLSAVGGQINWLSIGIIYLRYFYGLKKQGLDRKSFTGVYRPRIQPFASIWVIFWATFFILVSGLSVFWAFNGSDFVAAYINIPIFAMLYFGWKIWKRSKIIPLAELDFVTGIPSVEETEENGMVEKVHGLRQVKQWM